MKLLVATILLHFMINNIHGAPDPLTIQIIQKVGMGGCNCPGSGCCDQGDPDPIPTMPPKEPTTSTSTTTEPTPTSTTTELTTTGYCDTLRITICPNGNRCHANATCVLTLSGHICKCNTGYAGDGADCGSDKDIDTWPDVDLFCCIVDDHCSADNCPNRPNSGQEDSDFDGIGDSCDSQIDPHTGPTQSTTVGITFPPGFCIPYNTKDKCLSTSDAWRTLDSDGDGHMDSCDNCPYDANTDQSDTDKDRVGDACDTDQDTDNDGYEDGVDNCKDVVNPDQSDADHDGIGDKCDDDADNDGIPNDKDNCWLVPNPGQEDNNMDGFGNACQNDKDGDCVDDSIDPCIENVMIDSVDFRQFFRVVLDGSEDTTNPNFEIFDNGKEITQTLNSRPGLMYGQDSFTGVDFEGTFFIGDHHDDDYAGFVFAYGSSKSFYVVMWKQGDQRTAKAGVQLKKVNSITGLGSSLADALYATSDTTDQVTLLWHEPNYPNISPWEPDTAYRWELIHRPHIGLIRFRFKTGSTIVADSGNFYDDNDGIQGGRLGVFCYSQADITWSNMDYSCNDRSVPQEVYDELPLDKQANISVNPFKSWSGKVKTFRRKQKLPESFTEPSY